MRGFVHPNSSTRLNISGPTDGDALTDEGTARVYLMSRLHLLQKPLETVFEQYAQTYRDAEDAQRAVGGDRCGGRRERDAQ